jgi:asparagine synthase (glutamine-hydrolysing)
MCGICGIYNYQSQHTVEPVALSAMLHRVRHRGPDGEGKHLDRNLAIGARRLSIIDIEGGNQPLFNETGDIALVFNGEIYNYRELASRLRERGHHLSTGSDGEVIVHLYEDLGDACVHDLRGMFAFAIWDRQRRRLLAARDRLGIKPLYYSDAAGEFVFCSEIKGILQVATVETRLNLDALGNFMSFRYVPAPETMFMGIRELPAGHILTCDEEGVQIQRYWDLSFTNGRNPGGPAREEEYAEQLSHVLHESVKLHLMSDAPFGAFLSGGLDSSTIVALMSEFVSEPINTYSAGFEGANFDELPYARMVAARYSTNHHEVIIQPQDFLELAETIVWHLEQPIGNTVVLVNYMVAEIAARQVKMVLCGEGSDELFVGYPRYLVEHWSSYFQRVPASAKRILLTASRQGRGMNRARLVLSALCQPDDASRYLGWNLSFDPELMATLRNLLTRDVRHALNHASARDVYAKQLAHTNIEDPLSRLLYVESKLWLPSEVLARTDKLSMAVSLEARVPYLDHKVAEFAASLPSHLKVNGLTRKYLLKRISRDWLPEAVIRRRKMGPPVPFAAWFRREAHDFVHDALSPDAVRRRGLFDPTVVSSLLDQHQSGRANHKALIWMLLNVELWHRQFIDQ